MVELRIRRSSRRADPPPGTSGVAAVEFALVLPMLILLLIGCCDAGFMFYRQIQVDAAALAGATYAARFGWATNTTSASQQSQANIQAAAQDASALGSQVAVTATLTTGCLSTSTGQLFASGASQCSGNVTSGTYVTVAATFAYTTIIPYPGLSQPSTLSGSATVRIQ